MKRKTVDENGGTKDDVDNAFAASASSTFEKASADFECFVCGAIFTTDQDRKQHLEKEAHGDLHGGEGRQDRKIAKAQEKFNESHKHIV